MLKMVLNSLSCIWRCLDWMGLDWIVLDCCMLSLCISILILVRLPFQCSFYLSLSLSLVLILCISFCVRVFFSLHQCVCSLCTFVFVCILRDGWLSTLCSTIHLSSAKMFECDESFIFVSVILRFFIPSIIFIRRTVICSLNFLVLLLLLLRYYVFDARKLFLLFQR